MPTPATLHFFCGKPGAGKSTLAARLAAEQQALLLAEDIWLARLFGDQMRVFDDYVRFTKKLKTVLGPLVVDLLRAGQTVVLDFQGNTRLGRAWFLGLAAQAGAAHCLHWLQTPDALCLARIAQRNAERPEGSHPLSEADFQQVAAYFQPPEADEGLSLQLHGPG